MKDKPIAAPDSTAVRVALWRALHVQVDPPHMLEDEVGLALAAPDGGWRSRPDMSPFTKPFRDSIVARARFIDDLFAQQADSDIGQYVILGAGLYGLCPAQEFRGTAGGDNLALVEIAASSAPAFFYSPATASRAR